MKPYQRILIATNLSKESQLISTRASSIAQLFGAELSIVHILEINPMIYGGGEFAVPIDGKLEKSIRKKAEVTLTNEANRLNIAPSNQYLQIGNTPNILEEIIENKQIDLLIMGHHEQHGINILLGSTADSLLHKMPCDVLVVRLD